MRIAAAMIRVGDRLGYRGEFRKVLAVDFFRGFNRAIMVECNLDGIGLVSFPTDNELVISR
jgi:hypothetical protein